MTSKWFDFDEDITQDSLGNRERLEMLKRNFGLNTRKMESERKLKSWSSVNKVSDMLDLDSCRTRIFKEDRNRLWDSVIKDKLANDTLAGTKCRMSGDYMSDNACEELLYGLSETEKRIRSRFARDKFDLTSEIDEGRYTKVRDSGKVLGNSDISSSSYIDVKNCDDRTWSRTSSCQGNVTFPESSNASVISEGASEKSYGRSISINSEDSVCTEKSADCSTICETLPDGTNKTQFENNETWLKKSTSGSTICEKRVKDRGITEQNDGMMCDKSTKSTSYVEKSATGSSVQEESTSERTMSCNKNGTKTIEQKTSSETFKRAYKSPRSSSSFYDELDSTNFQRSSQKNDEQSIFSNSLGRKTVSEKISELIDEAVQHDNLFKIPSKLERDIDRMTSDFVDMKSRFSKEKRRQGKEGLFSLFTEAGKQHNDSSWSKLNELKTENEVLRQENSKLQSIIQDVTAVNKRWQIYNNERRLYVQKLLSTIQDLQEQINLISEKSAFLSSHKEHPNMLYENLEKLKREFQEHVTVLELQIKSHKEDWEAERKEKQKAKHEKEDLEREVQALLSEIKFLKNVLLEQKKRKFICSSCKNTSVDDSILIRNEFFPVQPVDFASKTFLPDVHVPYKMGELTSEDCYCSKDESRNHWSNYCTNISDAGETHFNELFSECTNYSPNKTSSDTIVVEDENGLRLSITEQYPAKDNFQLKSILKKTEKNLKLLSKVSEETEMRKGNKSYIKIGKISTEDRKKTCEECESQSQLSCAASMGFGKDNVAEVTSYMPYTDGKYEYKPDFSAEFLKVISDNRSKSEPNTRSNSPENLKPLRESSSWNNQCQSATGTTTHLDCDPSFVPAMAPMFLSQYQSSPNDRSKF